MNKKDRVQRAVDHAKTALDGVQTILSHVWAGSDDPGEWRDENIPALKQARAMLAVIEIALCDAHVAAFDRANELAQRAGDE